MKKVWRKLKDFILRILSLNHSPHGIALGFAVGLALSVMPGFGLGMALALLLAPFIKANPVATYLGTLVVNPLDGVFFYGLDYLVGNWILGQEVFEFVMPQSFSEFLQAAQDIALPLYLGSVPVALFFGVGSYLVVLAAVKWWKRRSGDDENIGEEDGIQKTEEA